VEARKEMIDCFMFFNELDLLEIRLNTLRPYVDRFVLFESPKTFSGRPKKLYYQENKARYEGFNITHLVADFEAKVDPWMNEREQRDYLMNGVQDVSPEELILHGDIDEIPDFTGYAGKEGVFGMKAYYFFLDVYVKVDQWRGTVAQKRGSISSFQNLRDTRTHLPIVGSGWHFSTLGSLEQIIEKIEGFSHQELNTPEVKNHLADKIRRLVSPYHNRVHRRRSFMVEMPSGPGWLLDNKEKYKHLFRTSL
jgi:beta-1,4-mannosyl-glycoprotein beta-1,4-N-acetylglucosaminyltransferase